MLYVECKRFVRDRNRYREIVFETLGSLGPGSAGNDFPKRRARKQAGELSSALRSGYFIPTLAAHCTEQQRRDDVDG